VDGIYIYISITKINFHENSYSNIKYSETTKKIEDVTLSSPCSNPGI
jgi:hypothetical protein